MVRRAKSRSSNTPDGCQVTRRQGKVADAIKICSCNERLTTIVRSLGLTLVPVRAGSFFRALKPIGSENVPVETSQAIGGP